MKNILDFRQISVKCYLWATETNGVTAIETGILVSGISAILASVGILFGDSLTGMFDHLSSALQSPIEYNAE